MDFLHIDIETYSSVDLKNCGHYKYSESLDFEILILAYALNDEPIKVVDVAQGEPIPEEFFNYYYDSKIRKYAHNAAFERVCFNRLYDPVHPSNWYCTAVLAGYCGLPMSLEKASEALGLDQENKGKSSTGKALIRYFSIPCKPTKANGGRTRNLPHHDPEKWNDYKEYCRQDVVAERAIHDALKKDPLPPEERRMYVLDQIINDRGVKIDTDMATKAIQLDLEYSKLLQKKLQDLTNVPNPNSPSQLKKWLSEAMNKEITSLAKAEIEKLISKVDDGPIKQVLELRKKSSKTSIKKYLKMIDCASDLDGRARGLFQFYGASRTGRWAGRLIQLQNLPRNYIDALDFARDRIKQGDFELMQRLYDDPANILSQLIRTALIAPEGMTFAVADFSAIEARVLAWLADETWRLDVFNSHGKIYEASAAMMFSLPLEECTKEADKANGTKYREKGKVAELALGYQGSVGALKTMGGEKMGLNEIEMKSIVDRWRLANINIAKFWKRVNGCAMIALRSGRPVTGPKNIIFEYRRKVLTVRLPSGRKLYYQQPRFAKNRFGQTCVEYKGIDQNTRKWSYIGTYGGKLTENIVQAIARDLLSNAMLNLDAEGYSICMHVHDEAAAPVKLETAKQDLEKMELIMSQPVEWAEGLPLNADGYLTPYYKKD